MDTPTPKCVVDFTIPPSFLEEVLQAGVSEELLQAEIERHGEQSLRKLGFGDWLQGQVRSPFIAEIREATTVPGDQTDHAAMTAFVSRAQKMNDYCAFYEKVMELVEKWHNEIRDPWREANRAEMRASGFYI